MVDLGTGRVSHSFLIIPDCPYPLLGRDLLTKLGAQITFQPGGKATVTDKAGCPVHVLTLNLEDEYRLLQQSPSLPGHVAAWLQEFPQVWAETGGMGLAHHRPPVFVEIKPGADPARVRQYPMSQEAKKGMTPHIRRLLTLGILRPCRLAWNTPLLPVCKPNSTDY